MFLTAAIVLGLFYIVTGISLIILSFRSLENGSLFPYLMEMVICACGAGLILIGLGVIT